MNPHNSFSIYHKNVPTFSMMYYIDIYDTKMENVQPLYISLSLSLTFKKIWDMEILILLNSVGADTNWIQYTIPEYIQFFSRFLSLSLISTSHTRRPHYNIHTHTKKKKMECRYKKKRKECSDDRWYIIRWFELFFLFFRRHPLSLSSCTYILIHENSIEFRILRFSLSLVGL